MGSYVAQIAEVGADGGDRPVVKRLWCAADCGVVVNPDIARAQIEGGMLYALDAVLGGGIELDAGQVIGRNFDRHRVLRMADAPAIAVELISSRFEPSGVGEIGVPCVAPAMANAWYRATGRRVRSLWGSAAWQRVEA
jgi:isoquinoline 1-oxidoreductase beta subunit